MGEPGWVKLACPKDVHPPYPGPALLWVLLPLHVGLWQAGGVWRVCRAQPVGCFCSFSAPALGSHHKQARVSRGGTYFLHSL